MKVIDQKEIGKRISEIRKQRGYSQEEFAKQISISRPSYTQIELGNRGLSALEIKKIAEVLHISVDKLLANNFELENSTQSEDGTIMKEQEIRVSIPKMKVEKFKNILLYILERCAGKPNVGETLLYKLLYFSDFNYYELYEEHLSGATYKKLPYGPVPQKLDSIINQMISKDLLKRIKTKYHGYPQTRFLPLAKSDLEKLKASEKDILDKVIDQYSDWSASAISEYSHKDIPWLASKDGEIIDYELVFYREYPFSVRNYDEKNEVL